jgi:hypothetical protein
MPDFKTKVQEYLNRQYAVYRERAGQYLAYANSDPSAIAALQVAADCNKQADVVQRIAADLELEVTQDA